MAVSDQRALRLFLDAVQAIPHLFDARANITGQVEGLVQAIRGAQVSNRDVTEVEWSQLEQAVTQLTNASGEARNTVLQSQGPVGSDYHALTATQRDELSRRKQEQQDAGKALVEPASGPDGTSPPAEVETAS